MQPTLIQCVVYLLQMLVSQLTILRASAARTLLLFDQFKVDQSNILKSVMTGLKNDLRNVRRENLALKASIERSTRNTKALDVLFLSLIHI